MLLLLFTSVLLASAQAKFYTDCGSAQATIQNVGVSGCAEDAQECVLKRNTNSTISIEFTPSAEVKNLETVVHGIIMNLPVPFPLPNQDACVDSGLTCPIKAGSSVKYATTLPILKSYPKVKVEVQWELKGEQEDDFVCVKIRARIN